MKSKRSVGKVTTNQRLLTELRSKLSRKLQEEGWDSIRAFAQGSGVPLSDETVRRMFAQDSKGMDAATLAIGKVSPL